MRQAGAGAGSGDMQETGRLFFLELQRERSCYLGIGETWKVWGGTCVGYAGTRMWLADWFL